MTVSSTSRKVGAFLGNGVTTSFPFTFKVFTTSDVALVVTHASGAQTALALGTDYSIALNADQDNNPGGTITYPLSGAAMPVSDTLSGVGDLVAQQGADLTNMGRFLPNVQENAFDYLTILVQQLEEKLTRTLTGPSSDDDWLELVAAASRLDRILVFDATTGQPGVSTVTMSQVANVVAAVYAAAAGPLDALSFLQAGTGAISRTAQDKARDIVAVFDFMSAAQRADVRAGTAALDVVAAWQAAIDYTMLQSGKMEVYGNPGRHRTSDTIHAGYGVSFQSVVIRGAGYAYRGDGAFNGTSIICEFTDRPGINFQGARGSVLRGVAIIGKNATWVSSHALGGAATIDDTVAGNWVDSSFPAASSSRYAPYAGITVDAYSGVRPATSYPNATYPASLGAVAQYGKGFSSDVLIEDCYIDGFVVGFVNQPCDADGNGDFTALRRCTIERCQYAISVCNTQSRGFSLHNVKVATVHTGLTNNTHGRQSGKLNGTIDNFHVGSSTQVFKLGTSSVAGPLTFLHLYCESIWRLGDLTASTQVETSIIFQSGKLDFSGQNDTRGVPATVLSGDTSVGMDLQFPGTLFNQYRSVCPLLQRGISLRGTQFFPSTRESVVASAYLALAGNGTAGGVILPLLQSTSATDRMKYMYFNADTLAVAGNVFSESGMKIATDRRYCVPIYAWNVQPNQEPYADSVQTPRAVSAIAKVSLTGVSLTDKTLVATFPGRTDAQFAIYGPDNGDVILDDQTGMTFFVRSRTGTTITAEAQNNYKSNGLGGFTPVTAFSTAVGNLYYACCRMFTPPHYLRGDIAIGSPIITNCARDDGFAAWYDAQIAVNDYYYIVDTQDNVISTANLKVTARDQAAGTITLNGNFARAQTRRRLALFVRQPPANA